MSDNDAIMQYYFGNVSERLKMQQQEQQAFDQIWNVNDPVCVCSVPPPGMSTYSPHELSPRAWMAKFRAHP